MRYNDKDYILIMLYLDNDHLRAKKGIPFTHGEVFHLYIKRLVGTEYAVRNENMEKCAHDIEGILNDLKKEGLARDGDGNQWEVTLSGKHAARS